MDCTFVHSVIINKLFVNVNFFLCVFRIPYFVNLCTILNIVHGGGDGGDGGVVWWCGGLVVWWFILPIIKPPKLTMFNSVLEWVV